MADIGTLEISDSQSTHKVCSGACKISSSQSMHKLHCLHCSRAVHLACTLHKFRNTTGNASFRNSTEWMHDFIQYSSLHYICETCMANSTPSVVTAIPTTQSREQVRSEDAVSDNLNMKNTITAIDSKVSELLSAVKCLQNSLESEHVVAADMPPTKQSEEPKYKTYAEAVSIDLCKAVKSAVSDSLKANKQNDHNYAAVIVYGLPETKNDLAAARKLLMDDIQSVIRVYRLGKPGKSSTASRPLKVELKR
jgi:hypothetical protein